METMKAGAILEVNKAEVVNIEKPVPGKGEVLVKIRACALCTFEQRAFNGVKAFPMPYLGGHELAGEIAEVGEGVLPKWTVGTKVAVRTITSCGQCDFCHMGEDTMCTEVGKAGRQVKEMDGIGGLAEYFLATPGMLYPLKEDLPFEIAALTEPLACVIHSIDQADIDLGDTVVIIGAGIMGLLHLQLAHLQGARAVVVEVDEARRKKAMDMGASATIDPLSTDMVEFVKDYTDGRGADVVICTPAISKLAEDSVAMVSKLGHVVLYGSFHPDTPISLSPNNIHYSQIRLTGAVNPGSKDFLRATRMINTGIIDLNHYVDATFPLDEIQKAYETSVEPGRYRVVVTME
ncbi:alcohol dehydrogenase catalytic domain-containing protein [Clostridia bacterium]|nr:alcohol dehydrogenase catalytic domain-containing protein [Clostridia bacterium]